MNMQPPPSQEITRRGAHPIVALDEWIVARKSLLEKEKELTRFQDRVCEARRALPWVRVDKAYVFEGAAGRSTLADLFEGRSQLMVQHFMLGPGWGEGCPGCSFLADHVDAARRHFEYADLSYVAVSRAPWIEIAPFQKRMGWTFPWVSSYGSDFNYDFQVSFTPGEVASGRAVYNFEMIDNTMDELPGHSVFIKDENGDIFRTYSSYARGGESMIGAFAILDFVPKGRNEKTTMDWVRHHDRYEDAPVTHTCGGSD